MLRDDAQFSNTWEPELTCGLSLRDDPALLVWHRNSQMIWWLPVTWGVVLGTDIRSLLLSVCMSPVVCLSVSLCVRMHMCMCMSVCVSVRMCVRMCLCVFRDRSSLHFQASLNLRPPPVLPPQCWGVPLLRDTTCSGKVIVGL